MEVQAKTPKVFRLGKGLAMCLPKGFCDKTGLKAGDRLGVIYDTVIIIGIPQQPKKEK